MKQLIIVSSNPGKLKEYQDKLKNYQCIAYRELFPDLDILETGDTFRENAWLKANAVFQKSQMPCVADDSGLLVDALPNQLGVRSKRFSKAMTDEANLNLLLEKLEQVQNRQAHFHTTICLMMPGESPKYYEGQLYGTITKEKRGTNGFGYDPIFEVHALGKTLAECTLSEKNEISHRSKAMEKLIEDLDK